jgi:hypothetical protein
MKIAKCWLLLSFVYIPIPSAAAQLSGSTGPAPQPASKEVRFVFQFKDAPLIDILDAYAARTGVAVVFAGKVQGRANILAGQPITAEEAYQLMRSCLRDLGYDAVLRGSILVVRERNVL